MSLDDKQFPIVAIGASAGGVEALSALFKALPPEPNAAFVVITHLAPNRESLLPEILARHTTMPVETAQDGNSIKCNHVYLNAADSILKVRNGILVQEPRRSDHHPIDTFLASLAHEAGDRMVAAILSGTGNDGSMGIEATHKAGGFTLAQCNDSNQPSPSHKGMPSAAIATGFVDCVLPIESLADRIVEYIKDYSSSAIATSQALPPHNLEEAKKALYSILQHRVGHDFSLYKDKTFLRRVERRMNVRQISDLTAYVDFIKNDAEEAKLLFQDLLISVTNFFRDEDSFEGLINSVIPQLFVGKGVGDTVRIWVPGCASGEEVYSIAMLLSEALVKICPQPKVQIFATDVDEVALAIARAGRYSASQLESLSPERRVRHFIRDSNDYIVNKNLRDFCLFSLHSVIRDPPFSQIDLISCRNLLIYFNSALQNQVLPLFHYSLKPGGYLFLGASENVNHYSDLFVPLDKKHRIFQRQDVGTRSAIFPLFTRTLGKGQPFQSSPAHIIPVGQEAVHFADNRILSNYSPAYVLITDDWDITHYSARSGKYFEAPGGPPSRNLITIARKGLRIQLRSAVQQAMETGQTTKRENISFETEAHTQTIDIIVEPMPVNAGLRQWMIVFTDVGPVHDLDEGTGATTPQPESEGMVLLLERELQQTREQLQSTIEEYETSVEELKSANEELLSVNEELQSSNEELETAREELQSLNEELHTVNSELSTKVDDLDKANNDLKNLFNSTQIATLFLGRDLSIYNFTPSIADLFRLIQSDRGRPLTDIVCKVDFSIILTAFNIALETEQPVERNISQLDGPIHYLMRIVPFRNVENKVSGGIVTFVDVTAMVKVEEHQRFLLAELNHRVKNTLAIVSSMAGQMARRYSTVNEFADNFIDRVQGLAQTHDILSSNEWSDVSLAELLSGELKAFATNGQRALLQGPAIKLKPRAATTIGIVIHELATNAVKYGALSGSEGKLHVTWEFQDCNGSKRLVLRWQESCPTPVQPPQHRGMGSELIERSLEYELGGKATTQYEPDGILVTLTIPANSEHMSDSEDNLR